MKIFMLKKLTALAFCLVYILSALNINALAQSGNYLPDFEIKNIKTLNASEWKVEGTFDIINNTEKDFSALFYSTEIYVLTQNSNNLIQKSIHSLGINANKTQNINFTNIFTSKIPQGKYSIVVRLYNRTGISLAFCIADIGKMGTDVDFLLYQPIDCYYMINGQKFAPLSGPSMQAMEIPKLTAAFTNITNRNINASAYITLYKRDRTTNPTPLKAVKSSQYTFAAGEKKTLDIGLLAMQEPESYQAIIVFKDSNGTVISGELEARYVVTGINAKIINSSFSLENNNLNISYDIAGPSDGSNLNSAKVKITVKNSNSQKEIFSNEKVVDLGLLLYKDKCSIPINSDIKKLTASITVSKDGKLIDEAQFNYPAASPQKLKFTDIVGTRFEDAVNDMVDLGYIQGYEDNTFRPLNNLKRAEFCTIMTYLLDRKSDFEEYNKKSYFKDTPVSYWGNGFVNILKDSSLIQGYPDGNFRPEDNMNYGEACTILVRYINGGKDIKSDLSWPDNYIEEASKIGITKSLTFKSRDKIIRGDIAIMALNAIKIKADK